MIIVYIMLILDYILESRLLATRLTLLLSVYEGLLICPEKIRMGRIHITILITSFGGVLIIDRRVVMCSSARIVYLLLPILIICSHWSEWSGSTDERIDPREVNWVFSQHNPLIWICQPPLPPPFSIEKSTMTYPLEYRVYDACLWCTCGQLPSA